MKNTYADKIREALTDSLYARICGVINSIIRYAAYSSIPQTEMDTTFQELLEYYYPNR